MPYASIADLPAPVQKLDAELQKQWLEVFNSIMAESDGDEERAFAGAWAVVNKHKCAALALVVKTAAAASVLKGDAEGHPFRGNQYADGNGGGGDGKVIGLGTSSGKIGEFQARMFRAQAPTRVLADKLGEQVPVESLRTFADYSYAFAERNPKIDADRKLRADSALADSVASFVAAWRADDGSAEENDTEDFMTDGTRAARDAANIYAGGRASVEFEELVIDRMMDLADSVVGAKPRKATDAVSLIKSLTLQMKGDSPGHPFRGNQYATPEGLDANSRAAGLPKAMRELIAAKREKDQAARTGGDLKPAEHVVSRARQKVSADVLPYADGLVSAIGVEESDRPRFAGLFASKVANFADRVKPENRDAFTDRFGETVSMLRRARSAPDDETRGRFQAAATSSAVSASFKAESTRAGLILESARDFEEKLHAAEIAAKGKR